MATRPRRHSVVTLRLTVAPDDSDDFTGSTYSPTFTPPRGRGRRRVNSPMHRTPPAPLSPSSPLSRTPSPIHTPTSPLSPRRLPSPRRTPSPRHFQYPEHPEPKNLQRRSSLLTVPTEANIRVGRRRSSSVATPLLPPDLLNLRHLEAIAASRCSSPPSSSSSSECGRGHASDSEQRRNSNATDISKDSALCRLRQFSTTVKGGIVNRGDSLRPRRSASNTSVISTPSSELPGHSEGSREITPAGSKVSTPLPPPQFYVAIVGASGVGRSALITQFMTSEYMSAYDDSVDEGGEERSVSIQLDGEEAELIFSRSVNPANPMEGDRQVDAWVVVYSISDKDSFRQAASLLGRIWAQGLVTESAVILVANKTDLERTRVISATEGRTLAVTYECKFIEVSAGIAHHVDELLAGILAQIRLKQCSKGNTESKKATSRRLKSKNTYKVKNFLNKLLHRDRKSKSCENLHVL